MNNRQQKELESLFPSPIEGMPEQTSPSGKFSIRKNIEKVDTKITIVSMRESAFSGEKPLSIYLPFDCVIHTLEENEVGIWMTDSPQERWQTYRDVKGMRGNILVGGLGLGYVTSLLALRKEIKRITVVEKEKEIIAMVDSYLPKREKITIMNMDLFDYLKTIKELRDNKELYPVIEYDYAYYDIWQREGEHTLITHVRPLRELSKGIVEKDVICWQEKTMLGQLYINLQTMTQLAYGMPIMPQNIFNLSQEQFKEMKKWNATTWPFYNWLRAEKPTLEKAQKELDSYVRYFSNYPFWRKKWGKWEN